MYTAILFILFFLAGRLLLGDLPELRPDIFKGRLEDAPWSYAVLRVWYSWAYGHDPQDYVQTTTVAAMDEPFGKVRPISRRLLSEETVALNGSSCGSSLPASTSGSPAPAASPRPASPAPAVEQEAAEQSPASVAEPETIPSLFDFWQATNFGYTPRYLRSLMQKHEAEIDWREGERDDQHYLWGRDWAVTGVLADDEDDEPYDVIPRDIRKWIPITPTVKQRKVRGRLTQEEAAGDDNPW